MGLPNLQTLIVSAKLKARLKLLEGKDLGMQEAGKLSNFSFSLAKIATTAMIEFPYTEK